MNEEFQEFDVSEVEEKPLAGGQQHTPTQILPEKEEATTPFHNATNGSATYNPQKEAPHHRWICNELSLGFTPKEVAERTGFSTVTVQYVRAQPWAQKYIAEMMQKAGRKIVMAELHGAALEAAKHLVASVKGEVAQKASDRSKDCWKLLERCFGAVPQISLNGNIDPNDLTDAELAAGITESTGTNK